MDKGKIMKKYIVLVLIFFSTQSYGMQRQVSLFNILQTSLTLIESKLEKEEGTASEVRLVKTTRKLLDHLKTLEEYVKNLKKHGFSTPFEKEKQWNINLKSYINVFNKIIDDDPSKESFRCLLNIISPIIISFRGHTPCTTEQITRIDTLVGEAIAIVESALN